MAGVPQIWPQTGHETVMPRMKSGSACPAADAAKPHAQKSP